MQYRISAEIEWQESELRSDAQGGAFLENRRGVGNLARSRLSGGSWAMSEPSWPAQGRLKAGCSQDWLPHKAAPVFIIRCDAARVMSNLCHLRHRADAPGDEFLVPEAFGAGAPATGDFEQGVEDLPADLLDGGGAIGNRARSEERRVGKE